MAYFEKTVVPKLLEIFNQSRKGRSIAYIDTLVGTDDLSFRVVEMDGCLTGNGLREALQFIYGDTLPLEQLACKFQKLLSSENSINSIPRNLSMVN